MAQTPEQRRDVWGLALAFIAGAFLFVHYGRLDHAVALAIGGYGLFVGVNHAWRWVSELIGDFPPFH